MSEKTIVIAHVGCPFDPPEVNAGGTMVLFEPNPNGGKLWLGLATEAEAEYLVAFDFFTRYEGESVDISVKTAPVPDFSWTRSGIAEWAATYLNVDIPLKAKADMLTDLQAAIEAGPVAAAAEPAPDAQAPAAEPVAPEAPAAPSETATSNEAE